MPLHGEPFFPRFDVTWQRAVGVAELPWLIHDVHDPAGINTDEKIGFLLRIRDDHDTKLKDYAKKFGATFVPKERPWCLKGDIAFPSATQNEIDLEDAKVIRANGIKYVFEGLIV